MTHPYTISIEETPPHILLTIHKPFEVFSQESYETTHIRAIVQKMNTLLDAYPDNSQDLILDLIDFSPSFNDLVGGLDSTTQNLEHLFQHPALHRVLVVTSNKVVEIGANVRNQIQYRAKNVITFNTLSGALKYLIENQKLSA